MKDIWTNRLSEYIDGELNATEREALEAHLATCGHCYATLGDLRLVVGRAKQLEDREPTHDLWAGIRAGITQRKEARLTDGRDRRVRRTFSLTIPQLLAASIALMLISGGGAWVALRQPRSQSQATAPRSFSGEGGRVRPVAWTGQTDAAIADLQVTLLQNEKRLDTATVRIVRENLAIIDRAIAEARIAVQNDPSNAYLNLHLADTMRRKVELLRRVNDLAAARS